MSLSSPSPRGPHAVAPSTLGLTHRLARRAVVALLATAAVLAATACGASPTTTGVPTAPPPARGHGALYVLVVNQGTAGPASATANALGLGDGKPIWQRHLSAAGGSMALGGGTLYLATVQGGSAGPPQGTLVALNASTGAPIWQHTLSSGEEIPLATSGDAVFAVDSAFNSQGPPTQTLRALRATDGTAVWSATLDGGLAAPATLGSGALYVVTTSFTQSSAGPPAFNLLAVDTSTGKALWHLALPGPLASNAGPLLASGVLYLVEQGIGQGAGMGSPPTSVIQAVRANDGTVLWHVEPPAAQSPGGVAVSGTTVCYSYVASNGPGGGIVALHAADGSPSWQVATQTSEIDPLVADGSAIYALDTATTKTTSAASVTTTLHAFDASSGKSLLDKPFPSLPIQADFGGAGTLPEVAGGVLYAVGNAAPSQPGPQQPPSTSIAVAIATSDGSLRWAHTLDGNVGGPISLATS